MRFVKEVHCESGYTLSLRFEDGDLRRVDLASYLDGEVFEPLKKRAYFKTVRVNPDTDTIVWNNGADFSPDFLYEISQPVPDRPLMAATSR